MINISLFIMLKTANKGKLMEYFKGKIDDNEFQGAFSQTASDSKGIIYGKKKKY